MDEEITGVARAYVYSGQWVADCPREGCGNVEFLYRPAAPNGPRVIQLDFYICSFCGMQGKISWPRIQHEIIELLSKRPIPSNRNWYPTDHPVALRFNIPHGQSLSDLVNENEEHGVR